MRLTKLALLLMPGFLISASAQQVLSVRSGFINYAEGIVYLDEAPFQYQAARIRNLENGQSLRTASGRVEIQLGPNATLWMGEDSVLRMEDSRLTDTQLRMGRGNVIIGVAANEENNRIRVFHGDSVVEIVKAGLYRLDSTPPQLRVYGGRAAVQNGWKAVEAKRGRKVDLAGDLTILGFDTGLQDALQDWANYRWWALFNPADYDHMMKMTKQQVEKEKQDRQKEEEVWRLYDALMAQSPEANPEPAMPEQTPPSESSPQAPLP